MSRLPCVANHHFGEIGDVWKHLPLAELLELERSARYWESHAGSARYPLTADRNRLYGVFRFVERAREDETLGRTAYRRLLEDESDVYPGSPLIAMKTLGRSARYLLCDTDSESIDSLREAVSRLGVEADVLAGDGIAAIHGRAGDAGRETLMFVDPFEPFWVSGACGLSAVGLATALAAQGVRVVYWYGFDDPHRSGWAFEEFRRALGPDVSVWCGEVATDPLDGARLLEAGMRGCGIVCANLAERSTRRAADLGRALAHMYRDATPPLAFRAFPGRP